MVCEFLQESLDGCTWGRGWCMHSHFLSWQVFSIVSPWITSIIQHLSTTPVKYANVSLSCINEVLQKQSKSGHRRQSIEPWPMLDKRLRSICRYRPTLATPLTSYYSVHFDVCFCTKVRTLNQIKSNKRKNLYYALYIRCLGTIMNVLCLSLSRH